MPGRDRAHVVGLNRREFVFLAAAGVSVLPAGGIAQDKIPQDKPGDPLLFGLTPVLLDNDLELLKALRAYLETATGRPVELVTRRTYQEVTALLVSGQLSAAWICGYPYLQFRDELELIAVPEWNGKPYYQAYLIVSADRTATEVSDLEGDIHAYSDPDSNSGYLVTRALLNDLGIDAGPFFRKTLFTYGHRNVIRAVASGLAQSGSVDGYVWEVMQEIEPELVGGTRVLRKSEWLGFPPIATSRALAGSEDVRKLRTALLQMTSSDEGRHVLDMLKLTGFGEPNERDFDGIAAKMAALRGVL